MASKQANPSHVSSNSMHNGASPSYIVQKNDTLASIARHFKVDMEKLQRQNSIYDPKDIYPGFILFLPKNYKILDKDRLTRVKHQQIKQNLQMQLPVLGSISSPFGKRWGHMHSGIDFRSDKGREVKAAASGVVVFAGTRGGYGRTIILSHSNHIETLYGHNQKLYVSKGDKVKQGEVISYMGKTGYATGVHLHFEVRVNGVAYDPMLYLPSRLP